METVEPTPALPTNATDPAQGLASTPLPRSVLASTRRSEARISGVSDTAAVQAAVIVAEPDDDARNRVMQTLEDAGIHPLGLSSLEQLRLFLGSGGGHTRVIVLGVDGVPPDDPALKEILAFGVQSPLAILIYASVAAAQTILHLQCLNHGAVDFIRKSPGTSDLLAAVRKVQKWQAEDGGRVGGISADRLMAGWVELTAASSLECLRRIQRFIDIVLAGRLPPDVGDDIRVILEEAGRNAIEWGNRFNDEKTFRISYRHYNDRVVLKFEDEGEGFNPAAHVDPTADPEHLSKRAAAGKRPGGYGIHMLYELMDEVAYSEKGNVVVMTKYLTPADA